MFQNINESTIEQENYNRITRKRRKTDILANIFSIKNIPIYIISFMMAMVQVNDGVSPFIISLLGACIANAVPVIGIVIASILGSVVKAGITGALTYILITLVMIASMFVLKPRYNEQEKSESIKLARNIFIATIIIQLAKIGITGFSMYALLSMISFSIITIVFYKIFVNSISVIRDFREEKAFSIEEVLGASLILAISICSLGNLNILGFSIGNILCILIVLILGWKNGVLVGTTAGVTIGVTVGVITGAEPILIAAYALSGMISGILNRFGRIGVIIGFCLGNVLLAYVANGHTVELIHFREILIASIGLLAIPKSIKLNIEEFIGKSNLLPVSPDGTLNKSKETAERLNNVSETIQEMAKTYRVEKDDTNKNSFKESNKEIFINELLDNLNGYETNMLYEDISNVNGQVVDEVFKILIDKQEINREDLLGIFAKCNSYIVGFDDKNISEYLEQNIIQVIRVINMSYKISKSNFVWKKRIEENKKNMQTQLQGVSKAIFTLAKDIEKNIENEEQFLKEKKQIIKILKQKEIEIQEISIQKKDRFLIEIYMQKSNNTDIEYIEKILSEVLKEKIVINEEASIGTRINFLSDDKFVMAIGNSEKIKKGSKVSGDSLLSIKLKDGKYLVAISDGMGSGKEAKQSSEKALKMLENLLLSGFEKTVSMELINTSLINQNEEIFATLDIAIIDLYKGSIEFIKRGACPTYIKNKNKVQIIKSNSLPAGIINKEDLQSFDRDIEAGDIMVMCSDGVLDSNIEYKNKELWIKYLLEDIEITNTKKITELIINEANDNNFGNTKDDMTIIACKFLSK